MSADYDKYLQSDHWKRLAEETKRLAGYRCQVCNSDKNLVTHHRTYERKGDEFQSDLTCLCSDCHEKFHDKGKYEKATHIDKTGAVSANYVLRAYIDEKLVSEKTIDGYEGQTEVAKKFISGKQGLLIGNVFLFTNTASFASIILLHSKPKDIWDILMRAWRKEYQPERTQPSPAEITDIKD